MSLINSKFSEMSSLLQKIDVVEKKVSEMDSKLNKLWADLDARIAKTQVEQSRRMRRLTRVFNSNNTGTCFKVNGRKSKLERVRVGSSGQIDGKQLNYRRYR